MARIRLDTSQDKIRFGSLKSIDASGESITLVGSKALRVPTGPESERPNSPLEGQLRFNTDSTDLEAYMNSGWITLTADKLTKVSSNDTTSDYLENKLISGSNITLTTNNDGSNETLTIDASTNTQSFVAAASDETSALSTGTAKTTFRMPYAFTITEVRASLTTAADGSGLTVDINQNGTSILSTKITIDDGEKTSTTASSQPVLSTTALIDDDEITVDIDGVDSNGGATGLKVYIIGTFNG